jgi:mono/diheme cytochrome c family protein
MGAQRVAGVLCLASALAFPLASAAQTSPPAPVALPGKPQTDSQKRGEAIFSKNCHLCHIFSNQKKALKILSSTELIGLFKKTATTEDGVRQLIHTGIPQLMPSFKYNFEPSELDDLIAYLKIR